MTTAKAGRPTKDRVIVDMNDLTCEDIEYVEEYIDASIVTVMDPAGRQGKAMRALGYVVARRTRPELTIEEAGKLRVYFKTPEAVPPTDESDS